MEILVAASTASALLGGIVTWLTGMAVNARRQWRTQAAAPCGECGSRQLCDCWV